MKSKETNKYVKLFVYLTLNYKGKVKINSNDIHHLNTHTNNCYAISGPKDTRIRHKIQCLLSTQSPSPKSRSMIFFFE